MPRGVANKPGKKSGRPRAPAPLVTRALELVEAGTHSVEDAAEEVGLGMKTVYRAREEVGVAPAEEIEPVPATWRPAALPSAVVAAVVTTADPEKARAVRRLVAGMGGTWDGEAVESLAAAWGCALGDVQALVIEASIEAGRCALPPELAREEALATLRSVRDKAATAADFKSQIVAAGEILKIQLAAAEGDGETMTKAQFVALARRLLEAVGPYPGAREAAIAVLSGG